MRNLDKICKICHVEESENEKLLYPCKCTGSIKFTHASCLFMFIKSSGKEYCTICKHKYEFEEIYKEGTPDRLPITILFKEALLLFTSIFNYIVKLIRIFIFLSIVIFTNGFLFLYLFEIKYLDFLLNFYILFGSGIFISLASFSLSHLFNIFSKSVSVRRSRRVHRIDSMSVLSSMASEALSQSDSPRNLLVNIAEERDLSFIGTQRHLQAEQHEQAEDSTSSNFSYNDTYKILFNKTLLPKCCNFVFFLVIFKILYKYVSFELPDCTFTFFLRSINLYDFTKMVIALYSFFLLVILGAKRWIILFRFFKIINFLFLSFLMSLYIDGICVHFLYSLIINNGILVDFSMYSHGFVYSFLFHFILGYFINRFLKRYISFYAKNFRPGLFWNLADPSNGVDFYYKLSSIPFYVLAKGIMHFIVFHLLVCSQFLFIIRSEISRSFKISNLLRLLLYLKIGNFYIDLSFNFFNMIALLNTYVIRHISRYIGMQNFLFNEDIGDIKNRNVFLKWCPNKHKFYDVNLVHKKYNTKVSLEDVDKYFGKNNNKDFGIFFVPKFFKIYQFSMPLLMTTTTSFSVMLLTKILRIFTDVIISKYKRMHTIRDILFALLYAITLYTISLCASKSNIKTLPKNIILFIYLNFVWPLWITFIVVAQYGSTDMSILPFSTFMILVTSSSFLRTLFKMTIFTIPLQNYSMIYIIRKLYAFTTSVTICISFMKYSSMIINTTISLLQHISIFYILLFILSILLINGQLKEFYQSKCKDIKRRNFLVSRKIRNFESK